MVASANRGVRDGFREAVELDELEGLLSLVTTTVGCFFSSKAKEKRYVRESPSV